MAIKNIESCPSGSQHPNLSWGPVGHKDVQCETLLDSFIFEDGLELPEIVAAVPFVDWGKSDPELSKLVTAEKDLSLPLDNQSMSDGILVSAERWGTLIDEAISINAEQSKMGLLPPQETSVIDDKRDADNVEDLMSLFDMLAENSATNQSDGCSGCCLPVTDFAVDSCLALSAAGSQDATRTILDARIPVLQGVVRVEGEQGASRMGKKWIELRETRADDRIVSDKGVENCKEKVGQPLPSRKRCRKDSSRTSQTVEARRRSVAKRERVKGRFLSTPKFVSVTSLST